MKDNVVTMTNKGVTPSLACPELAEGKGDI
jgi:hypothetical protein